MKKLASLVAVAAVAVMGSVSVATPSSANDAGAAIAGGVLGFMAGAAVAGAGPHYVYHDSDYGRWRSYGHRWGYTDWRWRRHIRECFATYPTYNPRTDTWVDRRGRHHRCRV
jgi:hypothetical protein